MAIVRTGLADVPTIYRRLRGLSLGLPIGIACSKTKLFRSDVLMDTVKLLQILGKFKVSLRYSLEVVHCKANVCIWIQDRVVIPPLCLEFS